MKKTNKETKEGTNIELFAKTLKKALFGIGITAKVEVIDFDEDKLDKAIKGKRLFEITSTKKI